MHDLYVEFSFSIFIGAIVLIILVLVLFISIGKSKRLLEESEIKYKSALKSITEKRDIQNQYRKNYRESGIRTFSDLDVVEFLLSLSSPSNDVGTVPKMLIDEYKTLRNIIDSAVSGEVNLLGVEQDNLFILPLIKDVSERYLNQGLPSQPFASSTKSIYNYLYHSMRGLDKEVFKVISLDAENHILDIYDASIGTVDTTTIHVREIIKHLILKNTMSVVFVHNHVSGKTTPSKSDKEITIHLLKACNLMEILMYDHIIIGDNKYYSFAESGFIAHERFFFE